METSNSAAIETVSPRRTLPPTNRQHRSAELKRQIVQETLAPGASVARVARAHGVNANQVFTWRRQYRQGLLEASDRITAGLLAVRVADPESRRATPGKLRRSVAAARARSEDTETHQTPGGTLQVELPKGRLRVTGSVDSETLRIVLEALRG